VRTHGAHRTTVSWKLLAPAFTPLRCAATSSCASSWYRFSTLGDTACINGKDVSRVMTVGVTYEAAAAARKHIGSDVQRYALIKPHECEDASVAGARTLQVSKATCMSICMGFALDCRDADFAYGAHPARARKLRHDREVVAPVRVFLCG
jgi:hypothetical protein